MGWVEGWFPLEQVPALVPPARVACAAIPVQPPELMLVPVVLEQVPVPVVLVLEARLLQAVLRSAELRSVESQSAVL